MRIFSTVSTARRKLIASAIGTLGVAIWFGSGFVNRHFHTTRPAVANAETAQTHALNDHGNLVYLTSSEYYGYYGMQTAGFLLLVIGMSLYAYWYRGDEALNREILKKTMKANESPDRARE